MDELLELPPRAIARVAVDLPLAHLDRPFDYLVPDALDADTQPGTRVRVRFAGRPCDGFVLERATSSDASQALRPIEKLVSPEVVLTAAQAALVRATADHYAGTFADVVRLAVPPRHGVTEKAEPRPWPEPQVGEPPTGGLTSAPAGESFLAAVQRGEPVRAHWLAPAVHAPEGDLVTGIVQAVAAAVQGGRGALVVVPDVHDVHAVVDALETVLGKRTVAVLQADAGPSVRYRNYLAVVRGHAKVVVGTRAAAFAPVHDLGLVVVLDDGDDLHADPRAPYPHTRQVAALRVPIDRCALLLASRTRTAEVQGWVEASWMHPIALERPAVRRLVPVTKVAADSDASIERDPLAARWRLPKVAFDTIRAGLAQGPVLVQVPRGGHLLALACDTCRTPARCARCGGPLEARRHGDSTLTCRWCGRPTAGWRCGVCRGTRLRAPLSGASRTAGELAQAFPGTAVLDSSRDHVIAEVDAEPRLVIATPGAEPVPSDGYAAAVLLDARLLLERLDLRAAEEALRRWSAAVALVRPAAAGGTVCLVGPVDDRAVQAMVRQDPAGFAERELADRVAAGFPPAVKWVTVDGTPGAVSDLLASVVLPEDVDVLGPVDLPPQSGPVAGDEEGLVRTTLRAPRASGPALVEAVVGGLQVRSARKGTPVRVRVDPSRLG